MHVSPKNIILVAASLRSVSFGLCSINTRTYGTTCKLIKARCKKNHMKIQETTQK